jgi:hypothetical protein
MVACGAPAATSGADADSPSPVDAAAEAMMRADTGVDSPSDVDHGAPSATYPAPHPAAPTVASMGGPILATPKLIAVTFPADPNRQAIEAFAAAIGGTSYWDAVATQYGVNPSVAGTPIHLAQAAPATIDDTTIAAWVAASLDQPSWGTPDPSAIYTVYYPSTTTVTVSGSPSCGYHDETQLTDGTAIAFAVIPETCLLDFPFPLPTGVDLATTFSSHEWIEAATDPFWFTAPAFFEPDQDHLGWLALAGSEVADLCAYNSNASFIAAGLAHDAQRIWSNAAASGGHDPCVPAAPGTYFNSAPVLDDDITFIYDNQQVATKGVKIALGGTKTIEVDLFSDGPTTGPWTLSAEDRNVFFHLPVPDLSFSFDRPGGVNGEKVYLTITVTSVDTRFNAEPFVILSTLGGQTNLWYGLVGN